MVLQRDQTLRTTLTSEHRSVLRHRRDAPERRVGRGSRKAFQQALARLARQESVPHLQHGPVRGCLRSASPQRGWPDAGILRRRRARCRPGTESRRASARPAESPARHRCRESPSKTSAEISDGRRSATASRIVSGEWEAGLPTKATSKIRSARASDRIGIEKEVDAFPGLEAPEEGHRSTRFQAAPRRSGSASSASDQR